MCEGPRKLSEGEADILTAVQEAYGLPKDTERVIFTHSDHAIICVWTSGREIPRRVDLSDFARLRSEGKMSLAEIKSIWSPPLGGWKRGGLGRSVERLFLRVVSWLLPGGGRKRTPVPEEVYLAIHDVLIEEWDPIGIGDEPRVQHEYDCYIPQIYQGLLRGMDHSALARYLDFLTDDMMGLTRNNALNLQIAQRLQDVFDCVTTHALDGGDLGE